MNIKTILLLFLLLIPFAGCDDDDFPFPGNGQTSGMIRWSSMKAL